MEYNVENKSNSQLQSLYDSLNEEHAKLREEVEVKLSEMENIEDFCKIILLELKKRLKDG